MWVTEGTWLVERLCCHQRGSFQVPRQPTKPLHTRDMRPIYRLTIVTVCLSTLLELHSHTAVWTRVQFRICGSQTTNEREICPFMWKHREANVSKLDPGENFSSQSFRSHWHIHWGRKLCSYSLQLQNCPLGLNSVVEAGPDWDGPLVWSSSPKSGSAFLDWKTHTLSTQIS